MFYPKISLEQIEEAIADARPEDQMRILRDFPHLLKISSMDMALLKTAEQSFDFWNNPDDIIYDSL